MGKGAIAGAYRGAVPTPQPAPKKKKKEPYEMVGWMGYCNNGHDGCYFYGDEYNRDRDDCPACDQKIRAREKVAENRAEVKRLKTELKLAKLELKEERELHGSTKVLAAPYLTKMKQVHDHVKEKL